MASELINGIAVGLSPIRKLHHTGGDYSLFPVPCFFTPTG
jgi:hypothetical protein